MHYMDSEWYLFYCAFVGEFCPWEDLLINFNLFHDGGGWLNKNSIFAILVG